MISRPRRGARRGSPGHRRPTARPRWPAAAARPRARRRPSAPPAPPVRVSLATSADTRTAAGQCSSWAAPRPSTTTSGRCSSAPAGPGSWKLATPLGVASNGGITVAAEGGPVLAAAIRPSQDLSFSPLASSSDNGAKWAQSGLLDARLAGYPDALAAAPGGGLIALTRTGDVELRARPGAAWATLASEHALAAAAGQRLPPAQLTSVAYSPSGVPLVAGACARPGRPGSSGWPAAAGPGPGPRCPRRSPGRTSRSCRWPARATGSAALLAAGRGTDTPARGLVQPGRHLVDPVAALPYRHRRGAAPSRRRRGRPLGVVLSGGRADPPAGPGRPGAPCPPLPATAARRSVPDGGVDPRRAREALSRPGARARPAVWAVLRVVPGGAGPRSSTWPFPTARRREVMRVSYLVATGPSTRS